MSKGEVPKKLCFVIGPIGDAASETRRHADWLLEGIIEPVFAAHFPDYLVERSDKISAPGSISSQIIIRLHTAELVIADMSLANANAFYEMGIRHMKRLPTIHMYSEGQNIPFDVKPYRAIPFKYSQPNDLTTAQALLKAAIEEVIKPGFVVDNPVTQARGVEKLEETATPEQRVLFDQVQQIQRRLDLMDPVWLTISLTPKADPEGVLREIRRLYPNSRIDQSDRGALNLSFATISQRSLDQALHVLSRIPGVMGVAAHHR
jgi:hypothetical protein